MVGGEGGSDDEPLPSATASSLTLPAKPKPEIINGPQEEEKTYDNIETPI